MTFYLYRSKHTVRAAKITKVDNLAVEFEGCLCPVEMSRRWIIRYDPSPGDYLVLDSNGEYSVEYGDITKTYEKVENDHESVPVGNKLTASSLQHAYDLLKSRTSPTEHVRLDDDNMGAVFAPQDVMKLEDAEALRRAYPLTYSVGMLTPEQKVRLKEVALNQSARIVPSDIMLESNITHVLDTYYDGVSFRQTKQFEELLFIHLVKNNTSAPGWKSIYDKDGNTIKTDHFIAGTRLDGHPVSLLLHMSLWELAEVVALEKAPVYDEHTHADNISRLHQYLLRKIK